MLITVWTDSLSERCGVVEVTETRPYFQRLLLEEIRGRKSETAESQAVSPKRFFPRRHQRQQETVPEQTAH